MSEDKTKSTTTPEIIDPPSNDELKVDMEKYVTKDDHNSQLDKIRGDERAKQAKSLADSKQAQVELKAQLDALQAKIDGKVDLPPVTKPDLSDTSVLAEMLEQIRSDNAVRDAKRAEEAAAMAELLSGYDKRFEAQKVESQKLVLDAQLDAYKVSLLSGSDLQFPELVVGSTKEELDASFLAVKEREQKISVAASAAANGENVQKPLNPGTPNTQRVGMKTRMEIASLDSKAYQEQRKARLEQARKSA